MTFLWRSKSVSDSYAAALFHIDSGTVRAALVAYGSNQKPKLLYGLTVSIQIKETLDPAYFLQAMERAFDAASRAIATEGVQTLEGIRVERVYCTFSSPWYLSQTDTIRINNREQKLVAAGSIEPLLAQTVDAFVSSRALHESVYLEQGADLVDKKVIEVKLNGYPTAYPYGKSAQTIEVTLYMSVIAREAHSYVGKALEKAFPHAPIAYHASALVSYSILRSLFSTEKNALIAEIGGEVTDLSIVRSGILADTVSYPRGAYTLIREVAKSLSQSPDEALSSIRMYVAGTQDAAAVSAVAKAIESAEAHWVRGFQEALLTSTEAAHIPRRVFLLAPAGLESLFAHFIRRDEFGRAKASGSFEITVIEPGVLDSFVTFRDSGARDALIALDALFAREVQR